MTIRCKRWRFYPAWAPFGRVVSTWEKDVTREVAVAHANKIIALGGEVLSLRY